MARFEEDVIDVNFANEKLKQFWNKLKRSIISVILGIFALVLLSKTFYKVEDGEAAVKLRLGLLVGVEKMAGIHVKIPFIDTVRKVNISQVKVMEFGYRTVKGGTETTQPTYEDRNEEAAVIVDAINNNASIALINLMIEYKIEDPINYLYKVDDVEGTLRLALEDVVRNAAQQLTLDEAKTKKEIIDVQVKARLQEKMNNFHSGIQIVSVNTQNVEFFPNVEAAYQQKENANQYKNSKLEEAEKYSNIIIPQATAEATKLIEEAMTYKTETVAKANAEVARFNALYEEYKLNPQIIKEKYYLEAMQYLIQNNEVIIDNSSNNSTFKFYNINGTNNNEKSALPVLADPAE